MSSKRSGSREGGVRRSSSVKKKRPHTSKSTAVDETAAMREYDFTDAPSQAKWKDERKRDENSEGTWPKVAELFPLSKDGRTTKTLSPRLAARLYDAAVVFGGDLQGHWDGCSDAVYPSSQKSLARYYGKSDKVWRHNLYGCFARLALRISRGMLPVPNCLGEIVALRTMVKEAKGHVDEDDDGDAEDDDYYDDYPPMSTSKGIVSAVVNRCFDQEDWLILGILFGEDSEDDLEARYIYDFSSDVSFSSSSSEEEEEDEDNESVLDLDDKKSLAALVAAKDEHVESQFKKNAAKYSFVFDDGTQDDMLAYARRKIRAFQGGGDNAQEPFAKAMNLHPRRWFVAFNNGDMTNHL